jgi:VanZ family protein
MLGVSAKHPANPCRSERIEPLGSAPPFWRKPNFLYYWLPPALWGLAVLAMAGDWGANKNTYGLLRFLLSWFWDLKPARLDLINFYVRKTGHFLAYALMYLLWFRAFRAQTDQGPWRTCLWSLGFCLFFSSMDEGRQWFYATRGASIRDVILDMSGASLAALIAAAVWAPGLKKAAISGRAEGQTIAPE